jgi:carboxyl-terminal processing protease
MKFTGPKLRLSLAALCGLLCVANPTAVPAQSETPATTVALPSPQNYLLLALEFIEAQSLSRKQVPWAQIRAEAETAGRDAKTIPDTYPIISKALAKLEDKHASFRAPVRATEITQGVANGYGFLATWPGRVVVSITGGGPAATAGLKLGDRIELVEGRQPKAARNAVAIPQKTKIADQLRLTVTRKANGGKTRKVNLVIKKGTFTLVSTPQQDPAIVKTVGDRIGYLELPGLLGTEEDQRAYASQAHESIRQTSSTPRCGWVIDVRRNRGGWVYPILAAAGPLYQPGPNGLVMGKIDAAGITEQWSYRDGVFGVNRPGAQPEDYTVFTVANPFNVGTPPAPSPAVAILMSGLTASAGEALVLAFRGQGAPGVRSFGEPSLGLTTFDSVGTLPDSAIILVSNAAMTDRTLVAQEGPISPDVAVTPDWNHIGDAADPVLRAATDWLNQLSVCRL